MTAFATMQQAKRWLLSAAAPEGSFRRRLLRKGKNLLSPPPPVPAVVRPPLSFAERLNVYDESSLARFFQAGGGPVLKWSVAAAAKDDLSAARMALGLLQSRSELKIRFPLALAEGPQGDYCRWLRTSGADELHLSAPAIANVEAAFSRRLGARPLQIFDYDANLAAALPLALTPCQVDQYGHWLLTDGKRHHQLLDEEICWFLFERAEDPFAGLVITYLRNPEWQRQFPLALTAFGWNEFVDWVSGQHNFQCAWLLSTELPPALHALDQLRQLYHVSVELQAAAAAGFRTAESRQRLVQWVRQHKSQSLLDEHWQVQLDAGIAAGAMQQTGVNVLGHLCYPAGVGEAARAVVHGLHSASVRTSCRDIPANFQTDRAAHGDYLGLELFDYTLLLVAPEPDLSRCFSLSRLHPRDGVYRIPIWYWELESVPPELTRHAASFQEIWAPTEFIARAMRSSMSIPVTHMLPGVQLPAFAPLPRSHFRLPDDRFLFFFMFDMCSVMERKNPLALIRAFQNAFRRDDPVALAIKVSRGDWDKESFEQLREATAAAGATLIDGMLTREEAHALLHCCDCYASLHRSEGFGLTMAEAMLMAKPVIATGYSGNLDFMSASNSLLVNYERVPITRDLPYYKKGSLWAEPSVAHAAEHLRWVFDHAEEARALGLRGQADAKSLLSYAAAGKRMARRLSELETARAAGHHRAGAA